MTSYAMQIALPPNNAFVHARPVHANSGQALPSLGKSVQAARPDLAWPSWSPQAWPSLAKLCQAWPFLNRFVEGRRRE